MEKTTASFSHKSWHFLLGAVGLITKNRRFDEWLEHKIEKTDCYSDLRSFADYLAAEMHHAVNDKPLGDDYPGWWEIDPLRTDDPRPPNYMSNNPWAYNNWLRGWAARCELERASRE
jgi:hypothetical protein